MPNKEIQLLFDCSGRELEDIVDAFCWRVDPIRAKLLREEEDIESILMINVEKAVLPTAIRNRIDILREADEQEANIAMREIIESALLLWMPATVHKPVRKIMNLYIGDAERSGFTDVDISALLEEMKKNFDKIKKEAYERVIEKEIKEVFFQSVSPRLDNLNITQREILANMIARDDLDSLAKKEDIQDISNKLDRLLNNN